MTDNHVHVGWYSDGYHTPRDVWQAELDAGIDDIVVSSTSTCAEQYKLVIKEMRELIQIGGSRVHPLLWVTPRMMKTWGIRFMLHSKIHWEGVKMHWYAHREWFYNHRLTNDAISIAKKLNVPVLLHTGEDRVCSPFSFQPLIKNNPDLTFVLAHGRPLDETIRILLEYPNTMTDTAFMPVDDVNRLVEVGLEDRVLFGTDAPINMLYNETTSTADSIKESIDSLQRKLPRPVFETIMSNHIFNH